MNSEEIYNDNVRHFNVVSRYNNGKVQAKCPAHNDKQASLTISKGDKCTLFHCHAGCKLEDILTAAGLEKKNTFYNNISYVEKWKMYIESREKRKIEAVYPYVFINGGYAFHKIRLEGKKILYGRLENERFSYGLPRSKPRKSYRAIYGDLNAIQKAIQCGKPVFVPEGEKDVDTLTKHGFVGFTFGSVNDWQSEFASILKDAVVYILADNDIPGQSVANRIYADLQGIAKTAKVITPMPDIPKADITDYFQTGHSKQDFEQLLKTEQTRPLQENVSENAEPTSLPDKLQMLNAVSNYETNDKGFGALFAEIFKDRHRYNASRKDFMSYDGKRWVDDTEGLSARSDAKVLSDALLAYGSSTGNSDYLKSVSSLCSLRSRNNMLQDSRDVYYFSNEDLDTNDYLLNVQNGTVDLSEDTPKFLNIHQICYCLKSVTQIMILLPVARNGKNFFMRLCKGIKRK